MPQDWGISISDTPRLVTQRHSETTSGINTWHCWGPASCWPGSLSGHSRSLPFIYLPSPPPIFPPFQPLSQVTFSYHPLLLVWYLSLSFALPNPTCPLRLSSNAVSFVDPWRHPLEASSVSLESITYVTSITLPCAVLICESGSSHSLQLNSKHWSSRHCMENTEMREEWHW